MEKIVALRVSGIEDSEYTDFLVLPGTTVLDALRELGIQGPNHYILQDENGEMYMPGQNFYEVAVSGVKYAAVPDKATVGNR